MKFLLHFFLCLVLAFTGFAAAGVVAESGALGKDASTLDTDKLILTQRKGEVGLGDMAEQRQALVETWIGRAAINMGWVNGDTLYKVAKSTLERKCPEHSSHRCTDEYVEIINTSRVTTPPHVAEDAWVRMRVHGEWYTEKMRQVLIELAAMTMQQLTTGENCYEVISMPGRGTACNIGNFIYINMPSYLVGSHDRNYIRVDLEQSKGAVFNKFKCCRSLDKVDKVTDTKKEQVSWLYGGVTFTRDAKCLISFQTTCGQCGPKCDSCGVICPDACPHHKCGNLEARVDSVSNNTTKNTIIVDTPSLMPEVAATNSNATILSAQKEKWDSVRWQHNGKALIETWVGRSAVNVGRLTGKKLYETMKLLLEDRCPNNDVSHECKYEYGSNSGIATSRITKFPNIAEDANLHMKVHAKFDNGDIHAKLIELAARTMESLTSTAENCYIVPGHDVQCNMADFVYINLPELRYSRNFIRVDLKSDKKDVYGEFKCCRSLNKVDEVNDHNRMDIQKLWGKEFSRDAKYLIAFQTTCGECGSKCDSCGWQCDDVCPDHDCK
ncbi:hypothetical protein DE146DRAFT_628443 [Phaeosphaeria sp. MPI-PUGE-AT-0046c]|nr:hypothetical protein DE146DRAFT_628443 [Phaeosphaeria sp. MPI-PUGE-AT-0046c]